MPCLDAPSSLTKSLGCVPTRLTFVLKASDVKSRQSSLLFTFPTLLCLRLLLYPSGFEFVLRFHYDQHVPRLVLHVRSRLVRLLPLDLRLRQVPHVRVPLVVVVVVQISGAPPGEEGAMGEGGRVSLARPLSSARVRRPHDDLLPDAAPRAPPRERLRPPEPQAVLDVDGRASEEREGVEGRRVGTVADGPDHRARALANAVCVNTVRVRESPKYYWYVYKCGE